MTSPRQPDEVQKLIRKVKCQKREIRRLHRTYHKEQEHAATLRGYLRDAQMHSRGVREAYKDEVELNLGLVRTLELTYSPWVIIILGFLGCGAALLFNHFVL